MNNEQKELLDEVYNNYITYIHDVMQGENQIYGDWYGKEEFINKCKTDPEFSEKWGLKIEERELSLEERNKWSWDNWGITCEMESVLDEQEVPTKLITITYNDKTIESYE